MDVDVEGVKMGGMVFFCVGVVVVRIVDEMGTLVIGEITGGVVEIGGISGGVVEIGGISSGIVVLGGITCGVGDEAVEEEGEDLDYSRYFCTTWSNSITNTSSLLNLFMRSSSKSGLIG